MYECARRGPLRDRSACSKLEAESVQTLRLNVSLESFNARVAGQVVESLPSDENV